MMNFKRLSSGFSFVEVIVALAVFAVVCGVLLASQGKSIFAYSRAVDDQLVVMAMMQEYAEQDLKLLQGHGIKSGAVVPLEAPAPRGDITTTIQSVSPDSQAHRFEELQRDEMVVTWGSGSRAESLKLVRFRYKPEVQREAAGV